MNDLFELPYEVQIVLVAGYLGYKVSTLGRGVVHRLEDILLQVLVYGLVGRISVMVLQTFAGNLGLPAVAAISIVSAVVMASVWRQFLAPKASSAMSYFRVYRDDHESSAWSSILATRAQWTYVQVHIDDGRVLESVFGSLPRTPSEPIIVNDDGIVIYVTSVYSADGTNRKVDVVGNDQDYIVTYVPRSTIRQIEIGWRK